MLRQASVAQLRDGEISRRDGYVALTMRFYPRGLKKGLRDEYRSDLAPEKALLADFRRWMLKVGHDAAFRKARYLERFALAPDALVALARLSELSRTRTVYLVCQCEVGERCHREILMLLAKKRFRAKIGKVYHAYPKTRVLAV